MMFGRGIGQMKKGGGKEKISTEKKTAEPHAFEWDWWTTFRGGEGVGFGVKKKRGVVVVTHSK